MILFICAPSPPKDAGEGYNGRDHTVRRWFGKGNSLQILLLWASVCLKDIKVSGCLDKINDSHNLSINYSACSLLRGPQITFIGPFNTEWIDKG